MTGREGRPPERVVKRSLLIAGHATSVSLEEPFWRAFKALAERRGLTVPALAAAIDAGRREANLSSAIRLAVLADLEERLAAREGGVEESGLS